uniref:NADH-ubiquinone oxidoreductase chain 4 n=1 Tax=Cyanoptyche gloeocystis TaxID=77922 RepID=A0A096Y6Y3_9EUKA|nr:NADH dehydrogenase subunit 4 [Cyanoptyche gloeocystis]AIM52084.1 NADH dehydrogenase subunit 4 [Cyanoptyche gloeocystis]
MVIINLLHILILLPIIGCLFSFIIRKDETLKVFSLYLSLLIFNISLLMWILFDSSLYGYQFTTQLDLLSSKNFNVTLGVDGISLFFIILVTFIIPVCLLTSWNTVKDQVHYYILCFFFIEVLLILVFTVLDILIFYICFETVLIPMYLIIGIWGSRERKIRAAYLFFLYTLAGSFLMLITILSIYFQVGSLNIDVLQFVNFSYYKQLFFWFAFFISFAIKTPMIPFHIWLPEAHVESPTAGSLMLAGILLKLGTYAFLRFSIPMFPYASIYFSPLVFVLSVIAIIYISITTVRQIDLKKIIAYSSVAHMNFVTLGLFSLNVQGIQGSVLLMISHGIVSPALFLCVGVLYDRYKTRLLHYYSGLSYIMPLYSVIFLFFTLSNISVPGTSSFIGEFLVLSGCYFITPSITCVATIGVVLGAVYSLWLYNRVCFGVIKTCYINQFSDVSRREFYLFVPLIFCVLWMGIQPKAFLQPLAYSITNLLSGMY